MDFFNNSKYEGGKNMKNKIIMFLLIIFLLLIGITKVEASTFQNSVYEVWHPNSGFNVFAAESNGWMDYNSWMIKSTIDSRTYYCVDPAIPLTGAIEGSHDIISGKENIIGKANLTAEKYRQVHLLAYYGYGYKDNNVDHTVKKWYGITQVMIWRVMRPDLTWTFKTNRNGTPSNSNFASEVREMQSLVDNHKKAPSFAGKTYEVVLGQTIEVEDSNAVVSNYNTTGSVNGVSVKKSGNKLLITGTKLGNTKVNFEKASRTTQEVALLTSTEYQDVIAMGKTDPATFSINVEVTGGTIKLQKIDSIKEKPVALGESTLKGAVYGVYNLDGKEVGRITTDQNGKGELTLEFGKYKVKEIEAPKGYHLSDEEFEVELTKENNEVEITAKDKVIRGKVFLTKKKGGAGDPFVIEAGAGFDILNKDGKVVEKLVTNEKGVSIAQLPYGTYTLHQTKGSENYAFVDDVTVDLFEEKVYEIELKNLKKTKLEFSKTDFSTGEPVPNTLVEIYTENDELVGSCRTDKNGKCELPNLDIGKYYILEKDAPKYYRLNEEKMPFEVKANGEIVKCNMKNHRKEGNLEFTKTDESGNNALEGALIEIVFMDLKQTVFKNETGEDGKIKLDGLVAGKYCIYERKAPEGYELSKDPICFELDEEGQTIKINMINKLKTIVPDTGLVESKLFNYVGLGFIVLGVVYLAYDKTKKNKK